VLRAAPAGNELYVFLGSSPLCIQAWDTGSGSQLWNVNAARSSVDDSSLTLVDSDDGLVVGDHSGLGLVPADHASYRALTSGSDVSYHPFAVAQGRVLVDATSNRGTPKTSVQALDLATGAKAWEFSMGKAKVVTEERHRFDLYNTSRDGTYTAHLDNDRVWIVAMFEGSSRDHTITTDSVDVRSGAASNHTSRSADTDDLIPVFGPPEWEGNRVLTRVGDTTVQLIDASTGAAVLRIT
jgi:outer membrane protein assembly factor BamB